MANILASSIRNKAHLSAFDNMIEQRFADIDFSPLLMNMVDTAPSNALSFLLDQFDVLGYKGLRFVSTDTEKRELLKKAIELHRHKGTKWSIREALKLIGITSCDFFIGTYVFRYDGDKFYDGSMSYAQTSWATFSLKINAATFPSITTQIAADIVALVNEYKPGRSKMINIIGVGLVYNGFGYYDGTSNYDTQIVTI